jgi:hypothetical protein
MLSQMRRARCAVHASAWYVALALLLFFLSQSALSAGAGELDAMLREFPSVDKVSARFPDSDTNQKARVRHVAALEVLIKLTLRVQLGDGQWMRDPRVGRIMTSYVDARNALVKRMPQDEYRKLERQIFRTTSSREFRPEVVAAFFSPEWQTRFNTMDAAIKARAERANAKYEKRTPAKDPFEIGFILIMGSLALLLIVRSLMLRRKVDRYEFENMTDGGVVRFATYEESRAHTWRKARSGLYMVLGAPMLILAVIAFLTLD